MFVSARRNEEVESGRNGAARLSSGWSRWFGHGIDRARSQVGVKGGSTGLLGAVLCLAAASRGREPNARHEQHGMHLVQFRLVDCQDGRLARPREVRFRDLHGVRRLAARCSATLPCFPGTQGRSIGWAPSDIAVVPSGDGRAAARPDGLVQPSTAKLPGCVRLCHACGSGTGTGRLMRVVILVRCLRPGAEVGHTNISQRPMYLFAFHHDNVIIPHDTLPIFQ
jgi:hypothetical protein